MSDPISKHIFLFPFKWEVKTNKTAADTSLFERTNLAEFKNLIDSKVWKEYKFKIEEPPSGELNPYNEYAYFYDHVRTVLNLSKNDDSYQFNYKLPKESKAIYRISILGEHNQDLSLEIDDIFLNIYHSGVAVIGFILTNWVVTEFSRLLKINEYGRRIYPQFLGAMQVNGKGENIGLTSDTKFNFLADKIELIGLCNEPVKEDFAYYDDYVNLHAAPFVLPKHISKLIGDKFKTSDYNSLSEGEVKITPVIDDRMFVMSFLFENTLIKNLSSYDDGKESYAYLNSDEWFRYVFVDDSNPSCTSRAMKRKLLADCTYDRWIANVDKQGKDSSVLFGISRYSFVMLAASEWFTKNVVYLHFSNMYFQLVLLSLVQRASILSYAGEATRIVDKIKDDENLTDQEIKDINSLAQSFLVFKNQIYYREVTAQDQGIEIYKKIHQQMNLETEVEALEAEIEDLIGFVNANSETTRSKELQNLTRIATWFLPAGFIVGLMGINAYVKDDMNWGEKMDMNVWRWIFLAIIISVVSGEIMFGFSHVKRFWKFCKRQLKIK